jgi:hypothetical protein
MHIVGASLEILAINQCLNAFLHHARIGFEESELRQDLTSEINCW